MNPLRLRKTFISKASIILVVVFAPSLYVSGQNTKYPWDNIQFTTGIIGPIPYPLVIVIPEYQSKIGNFPAIVEDEFESGHPSIQRLGFHMDVLAGITYRRNVLFRMGLGYRSYHFQVPENYFFYEDMVDEQRGYVKVSAYWPSKVQWNTQNLQIPMSIELRSDPVKRWQVFMAATLAPEFRLHSELISLYKDGLRKYHYRNTEYQSAPSMFRLWIGQSACLAYRYDPYGTFFLRAGGLMSVMHTKHIERSRNISETETRRYLSIFQPSISVGMQVRLLGSIYENDPWLHQNHP